MKITVVNKTKPIEYPRIQINTHKSSIWLMKAPGIGVLIDKGDSAFNIGETCQSLPLDMQDFDGQITLSNQ